MWILGRDHEVKPSTWCKSLALEKWDGGGLKPKVSCLLDGHRGSNTTLRTNLDSNHTRAPEDWANLLAPGSPRTLETNTRLATTHARALLDLILSAIS